uniref:Ig-like domain-containing protein n=1 Tax=Bubo bubo TaxID=30461 RepID=A0A8C0EV80_BUBBB
WVYNDGCNFNSPCLGFCYSIINGPTNATVLAGSEVRFNCTVSVGWVILIWLSNGNPVLTVINSQGAVETSDRFTSQNYTSSIGFTSELIIRNTQLSDSGKIECSTQQPSENSFAFLSVQVNGSLFIKNSTLTVKENKTVEIVCEALGWAPSPDITWMTNDSVIDKSRYVTQQSQGSNGLHNTLSILTLTPTDTEILTCLADIEALPNPQNATVTVIFVTSTIGTSIPNIYHQSAIRKSVYMVYLPFTEQESGHQEKLHIPGPYLKVFLDQRAVGPAFSSWHGLFRILEEG